MQSGKLNNDSLHVLNCLGKANIVTVAKILNHFNVNYNILHDSDSPKAKRKDTYIINAMWTMNQKINNEVILGKQKGLQIKTFISLPNFEGEYLDGVTGESKPYEAWKVFSGESNEKVEKFLQIPNRILGVADQCSVEYKDLFELIKKVSAYVVEHRLTSNPLWTMTNDDFKQAANK